MDNDGDVSISLLDEVPEDVGEEEYITSVYQNICQRYHRTDGVYEADLWFDMFCTNERFWFMSEEHPYAIMIAENNERTNGQYPMSGSFTGSLGRIVVYEACIMRECVESIRNICDRHALKIIDKNE